MIDRSKCKHNGAAWKPSKKPVLLPEGKMKYSELKCPKCGDVLDQKFEPINKKGKRQSLELKMTSSN